MFIFSKLLCSLFSADFGDADADVHREEEDRVTAVEKNKRLQEQLQVSYTPHEGPGLANQKGRKMGVFHSGKLLSNFII